jgi:hypothetical protein
LARSSEGRSDIHILAALQEHGSDQQGTDKNVQDMD